MLTKDVSGQLVRRPVVCQCHLTCLPRELLVHIVKYLTPISRCCLRFTCRTLYAVTNDPVIWRHRVAEMNCIGRYNKTIWNMIKQRRIRHLSICNTLLTPNNWHAICQHCLDIVHLRVSNSSFLQLSDANARTLGMLRELDLTTPEEWTGSLSALENLPALRYLTLSCRRLKNKPLQVIAKFVMPLTKLQGLTLRLSIDVIHENLNSCLDMWSSLHSLDIDGPLVDATCLIGSALSKLPEQHHQLDTLHLSPLSDDFHWLQSLKKLKSLTLDIDEGFWQNVFSAVTHLHKLANLTISVYNNAGHILEVTNGLPPLVTFTLHRNVSRCTHRFAPCRLSLPSLCTQVSASLKKLSLMYASLSSSDLQCIVGHLPNLEELHCRLKASVHRSALLALQNLYRLRKVQMDCSANDSLSQYLHQLQQDSQNRIRTMEQHNECAGHPISVPII